MTRRLAAYPIMVLAAMTVVAAGAAADLSAPARDLLAVVVCVVAVAGVLAWSERLSLRARPSPARRPRPPVLPGSSSAPTFGVVALGPRGSGKTVYLSSLFHELERQAPDRRPYYLTTDAATGARLNEAYARVSDRTAPWPPATPPGDRRELLFDLVARDDDDRPRTIVRISSWDYAGESLSDRDLVTEMIANADALLGLVDGFRVKQLLSGDRAGADYVDRELLPMLGLMRRASGPVQLVLTKWDLVRDFGEGAAADDQSRLQHVIDALMGYPGFRALAGSRSPDQRVRLIPVSAVGDGFAAVDASGQMRKLPGSGSQPTNIDLPLTTVLADLLPPRESSRRSGSAEGRLRRTVSEYFRSQTARLDLMLPQATIDGGRAAGGLT